jgi:ABC-2 type transport system permease protein
MPPSPAHLLRYRTLVRNLVFKDLKLKYRDSVLGVVWSLLNPALLLMVYAVAFKVVLRVQTENYPYFLLAALLPWTFFSSSFTASTQSITGNANLIRKVYFPREILPIATVLFAFSQLLLALVVFLPALVLVSGVRIHSTALLFAPVLLLHLLFTLGLAFILSTCTVFSRDIAHLTEVALVLFFWLTPIVYPVSMVPPKRMCDRVCLLLRGRLEAEGGPGQVIERYQAVTSARAARA